MGFITRAELVDLPARTLFVVPPAENGIHSRTASAKRWNRGIPRSLDLPDRRAHVVECARLRPWPLKLPEDLQAQFVALRQRPAALVNSPRELRRSFPSRSLGVGAWPAGQNQVRCERPR